MYSYRRLFSADHRDCLVFTHVRDDESCLKYWKKIGAKFVVQSYFLASWLDVDSTDEARAKRSLEKALASSELVFGIIGATHIGFPFQFLEDLKESEKALGSKGLNFVVVSKRKFQKAFPKLEYSKENVLEKVKAMEGYFQSSLNSSLTEVLLRREGEKTEVIGIFANDELAYEEARKKFPRIKYGERDFVANWDLKPDVA